MNTTPTARNGWLIDLLVIAVLVAITAGVLLVGGIPQPVVLVLGIPFLLFLPGYALVSAIFPTRTNGSERDRGARGMTNRETPVSGDTPGWIARLGLSIVLSAVIVAVIGVTIDLLASIRLGPAVVGVSLVTLLATAIAAVRRGRLEPSRRAAPLSNGTDGRLAVGTRRQTIALGIAVVALVGSVAFVAAVPSQGEAYTETYLLTEGPGDELVADGYPTTFVTGNGHPLFLGIANNEHRPVTYEVVVVAQDVAANGSTTDEREIDRFSVDLVHGERAVVEREIVPEMPGDEVRLQFQIYIDGAPDGTGSADQTLQLWIDVVDGTTGSD